MHLLTTAIVCAVRGHGEHGVVARLVTAERGLLAGYVRGGRSTRLRPVLVPGNLVVAEFRARTEEQLAALTVELAESRAPLLAEPLAAAAIEWVTALAAAVMPEGQPYPRLHAALDAMLRAIGAAPSARGWVSALIRYETLALVELGYGDGAPLLPDAGDGWDALLAALDASGARVQRELFTDARDRALDARERLVARLRRTLA